MSAHILPSSRLIDPKATVMVDWPLLNGKSVRIECEPIFCFNCGKPNGYAPCSIMSFVSWLCMKCAETWGEEASKLMSPDDQFWQDVQSEMESRYGRVLTGAEIDAEVIQGDLGASLKLLDRESPYRPSLPS